MKWGLNFIESIKLVGRFTCNKYILVATNYSAKMDGSENIPNEYTTMIVKFLYEYILIRFGCLLILVTN
jgi:hypothetical protein